MKTAIALGTFDGLHKGHRAVLELPQDMKRIAVVFDKPPKSVISGSPMAIMSPEDKRRALTELGIDEVFFLSFDKVRDMSCEEFFEFIKKSFSPSLISCGFNYRFGKNALGNTELLRKLCSSNGIELKCTSPVTVDGFEISSTEIRRLLERGEIERANKLLYKSFSYTAEVVAGDKRGRTLGFPTVNQKYPDYLIPIKFGVYKSKLFFDNAEYDGITNIGIRPTWQTDYIICETYIKNFSGDLYGKSITVTPVSFVRGERKFSSPEELVKQIKADMNS